MHEVISIHVGQAGVQVGNACWELFCLEHGISNDGVLSFEALDRRERLGDDTAERMFSQAGTAKHIPRALFVDLEPTVMDEIRMGDWRRLYHPEQLVSGKECAANNFARGHDAVGKELVDLTLDRLRKLTDSCSALQGFMVYQSVGGGTGSGFGSLLLERLSESYAKKTKLALSVFPSPRVSTTIVEPYNAVLATHTLTEHVDACVLLDNEAMHDIFRNSLDIQRPTYMNLNRLVAQVMSCLTSSMRFDGALNAHLGDFTTNLVPFPRIHFLQVAYAPLMSPEKASRVTEGLSTPEHTLSVFAPQSILAKCDPSHGLYLACCLMYRGDVVPKDLCLAKVKSLRTLKFVDWAPSGMKCGISYQRMVASPGGEMACIQRALCAVSNSTAVAEVFDRVEAKFDLMYAKRAYVHWYTNEGVDEHQLCEAREDLADLQKTYEEINSPTLEEELPEEEIDF